MISQIIAFNVYFFAFYVCSAAFGSATYIPKYLNDKNSKVKEDSQVLHDNGWVELGIDVDTADFSTQLSYYHRAH